MVNAEGLFACYIVQALPQAQEIWKAIGRAEIGARLLIFRFG
jgi:hypothetical protein